MIFFLCGQRQSGMNPNVLHNPIKGLKRGFFLPLKGGQGEDVWHPKHQKEFVDTFWYPD